MKLIASIWVVHELEVGIFSVIIQIDENVAWKKLVLAWACSVNYS